MLTPDQIDALQDAAGRITDPLNDYLLTEVARRISEAGQLTSTAAYEVWRLQNLGVAQSVIKKRLQKILKASHNELCKLLTQTAQVGYDFDIKHLPFVQALPFEKNFSLQQLVSSAVKLAQDDLTNMVQTIGFIAPDGKAYPLTQAYQKACDFAFSQTVTGASDYHTAIRNACRNLADMGIQTIDYKSGISTSLEAAVRRNVMGGLGLMQEQISQQNHDALGADGWEISAHANSAPDHEPIQGKQYSDKAFKTLNNSLKRRIGTLNCGHAAFPVILGVSSPQYTDKELQSFRDDNSKGITYGGRHYTGYEATQMQRRLERSMRKQKRRILVGEATGDAEKLLTDQIKLRRLSEEYKHFSKATGLRTEPERAQVVGFGKGHAARVRVRSDMEFKEIIAKAQNNDKIVLSEDMEEIIARKPFSDIRFLQGKLSDRAVRKWYLAQDAIILCNIDINQEIESQAREACTMRNQNRTWARDLMRDQNKRRELDISDPNKSFEDLLDDKMKRKGLTRDKAIKDILGTATKTRKSVNQSLGLG